MGIEERSFTVALQNLAVHPLAQGAADVADLDAARSAGTIQVEVVDLLFIFASAGGADTIVDGPFGQKMHPKPADQGIVGPKLRDKREPVIDQHDAAMPATVAERQAELAKRRK